MTQLGVYICQDKYFKFLFFRVLICVAQAADNWAAVIFVSGDQTWADRMDRKIPGYLQFGGEQVAVLSYEVVWMFSGFISVDIYWSVQRL